MTVGEILAKIKRYYPRAATWTDSDIVSVLNDEQREIFRELQKTEIYEFETVKDQPSYSLPTNCEVGFIEYLGLTTDNPVTVSSTYTEYSFADTNDELAGNRYFDFVGLLGLYPIPDTSGQNVKIIYEKRPALLSADNQSASPDLNEDWHRIFVYAAITEIAGSGSNPDVTTVNNFTLKYNELMGQILLAKYKKKRSKNVKDWSR